MRPSPTSNPSLPRECPTQELNLEPHGLEPCASASWASRAGWGRGAGEHTPVIRPPLPQGNCSRRSAATQFWLPLEPHPDARGLVLHVRCGLLVLARRLALTVVVELVRVRVPP